MGFIDHDKFKAIHVNAIGLWLEGKNYCDRWLTDGLIPAATAKHFRFFSQKTIVMLTTSAGPKPGAQDNYRPLWELIKGFGWKMHEYLEHNESREAVLARKAKFDAGRDADRARLAGWREAKRAKRETPPETRRETVGETVCETSQTPNLADMKRSSQKTEDSTQKELQKNICAEVNSAPATAMSTTRGSIETRGLVSLSPVFLAFPVIGSAEPEWALSEHQVCEWERLFPGLDVRGECRKACAWSNANLSRRKTARGMPKFLVRWLSRAVDRGGLAVPQVSVLPFNKRVAGLVTGGQMFLNRQK